MQLDSSHIPQRPAIEFVLCNITDVGPIHEVSIPNNTTISLIKLNDIKVK